MAMRTGKHPDALKFGWAMEDLKIITLSVISEEVAAFSPQENAKK